MSFNSNKHTIFRERKISTFFFFLNLFVCLFTSICIVIATKIAWLLQMDHLVTTVSCLANEEKNKAHANMLMLKGVLVAVRVLDFVMKKL